MYKDRKESQTQILNIELEEKKNLTSFREKSSFAHLSLVLTFVLTEYRK